MATKKSLSSDAAAKARQVAEKAKPHMRVVEVAPLSDEQKAVPDAVVPDLTAKVGAKAAPLQKPVKELHMVVMEPKKATDARAPKKLTLVVDEDKVVGEQG